MSRNLILCGAASIWLIGLGVARAADPAGIWITQKGDAKIEISDCGGSLCGKIVSLREPADPKTGEVYKDKKNPDETQRDRPIVGVQILRGLKPQSSGDTWKGEVYNPEDGNTYRAEKIVASGRKV